MSSRSGVDEYAQAGVDYRKIEPFKRAMMELGRSTMDFPRRHQVAIEQVTHSHGAIFSYYGKRSHRWCSTQEGLGNKNWIAEWMYKFGPKGRTYHEWIGWDAGLMAVNDVIAQGAMPVVYTDEVAAGDSEWFEDEQRARDLAQGYYRLCREVGMALPAGESPSLRYLIKAALPVASAPSFSGCVTGIIAPSERLITGAKLEAGDCIIAAPSTGIHCNGISLVIERGLGLPEQFLTKLPTGRTLGEEALLPTRSYVGLVETLLKARVDIHALLPGTGSGVSKIAYDSQPFTYRVHSWFEEIPPLFSFMRELGVSLEGCLRTFNWGGGYYIFVPRYELVRTLHLGQKAGYDLLEVGCVEEGERKVIFEPEGITLSPPGE